jgi:hypothetical protein
LLLCIRLRPALGSAIFHDLLRAFPIAANMPKARGQDPTGLCGAKV